MRCSERQYTRKVLRNHEISNNNRTISLAQDLGVVFEVKNYFSRFDLERLLKFLNDPSKLEGLLDESLLFANVGDRTLLSVIVRMTDAKFLKIAMVAAEKLISEKQTVQSGIP